MKFNPSLVFCIALPIIFFSGEPDIYEDLVDWLMHREPRAEITHIRCYLPPGVFNLKETIKDYPCDAIIGAGPDTILQPGNASSPTPAP